MKICPNAYIRISKTHYAVTVAFMGWRGKENGELIRDMLTANIQVLVTLDKNLQYQQNFKAYAAIVVVIHAVHTAYAAHNHWLIASKPCWILILPMVFTS